MTADNIDPLLVRMNIFTYAQEIKHFDKESLLPHQVELVMELATAEGDELRRQRAIREREEIAADYGHDDGRLTPVEDRSISGSLSKKRNFY